MKNLSNEHAKELADLREKHEAMVDNLKVLQKEEI